MRRHLSGMLLTLVALFSPTPLSAQTGRTSYPAFAPRGFVTFSQQQFTAKDSFEAVFGESTGSFRGGGVDVVLQRNLFIEIGFARFEREGQRVFRHAGETFRLGIPLTATIRPIETVAGYRVTAWRSVVPYGGVGVGSYRYEEASDFAATGEDVKTSATGLVLVGGAEVRLARFIGVSAEVRYSRIEEVLGSGGISQEFGDTDLGGTAARFRIIIGR